MDTRRRYGLSVLIGLAMFGAACSGESEPASSTQEPVLTAPSTSPAPATTAPTTTAAPETTTTTTTAPLPVLRLDLDGLPPLEGGLHYEGWAIIAGEPVTTGKFNVSGRDLISLDGDRIEEFEVGFGPDEVSTVVITIEPAGDDDLLPADTHILAGDVTDGTAQLTIGHPAAIGSDFSTATGKLVLATPSTETKADELSGIWFLTLPGPEAGLALPELPPGWKYEGWAVIDGQPLTSGKFVDVAAADEGAPFGGPGRMPNFPGEDYVANAPAGVVLPTDLSGMTVVISVEPEPDDGPQPFVLKPLVARLPDPAEAEPVFYEMQLETDAFPTGVANLD